MISVYRTSTPVDPWATPVIPPPLVGAPESEGTARPGQPGIQPLVEPANGAVTCSLLFGPPRRRPRVTLRGPVTLPYVWEPPTHRPSPTPPVGRPHIEAQRRPPPCQGRGRRCAAPDRPRYTAKPTHSSDRPPAATLRQVGARVPNSAASLGWRRRRGTTDRYERADSSPCHEHRVVYPGGRDVPHQPSPPAPHRPGRWLPHPRAACRPCSQSRRPGSEPLPTHPPRHTASAVTTAPPHDRRCPSEATAGLVPGAAAPGTGANINETPQRSSAPTLAGPRTGWIVQRSGEGRRERSLVVPPFAERLATSTRPTPRHTGDRSVSVRTGPARQTDGRLVWAGWRG